MNQGNLVEALKALAHPTRLQIMQALTGIERNVGEIDEATGIGQPTLSQQLAILRNSGLVTTRKDAKLVYYRIDKGRFAKVAAAVGELADLKNEPPQVPRKPASGVANFARLA